VQRLARGFEPGTDRDVAATGLAVCGTVESVALHTLFISPAVMSALHKKGEDAIATRLVVATLVPDASLIAGGGGAVQGRRARANGIEVDYAAPPRSGDPEPVAVTVDGTLATAMGDEYATLTDESGGPTTGRLCVAFDAEAPRTKSFVEVGAQLLVCTHPGSPLVDSFRSLSTLSLGRAMEGQEELGSSWVGGIDAHRGKDDPLPGEDREGVDSDEWSD
jgi:hypothetical protein